MIYPLCECGHEERHHDNEAGKCDKIGCDCQTFWIDYDALLTHLAALTAERDTLREQLLAALTESVIAKGQLSQALSNGLNPYLKTERDSLREQLFKATKDLKRMAHDWREHAAGRYCSIYNPEMGKGLRNAASNLEDYINDRITENKDNER